MKARCWVLAYDKNTGELCRFAGCVAEQANYHRALFELEGWRVEVERSIDAYAGMPEKPVLTDPQDMSSPSAETNKNEEA